ETSTRRTVASGTIRVEGTVAGSWPFARAVARLRISFLALLPDLEISYRALPVRARSEPLFSSYQTRVSIPTTLRGRETIVAQRPGRRAARGPRFRILPPASQAGPGPVASARPYLALAIGPTFAEVTRI